MKPHSNVSKQFSGLAENGTLNVAKMAPAFNKLVVVTGRQDDEILANLCVLQHHIAASPTLFISHGPALHDL